MAQSYTKGDELIPGYRLMKFLGRGGFGEVWQASGPGGTRIAIKIINLSDKQGLKEFRAIRLFKGIHHPNLVPISAFWLRDEQGHVMGDGAEPDSLALKTHEADLIIAMGLGDKNLYDRLKECRDEGKQGIPVDELVDYMESAAKAIDYLNQPTHVMGGSGPTSIQHCDIKPQNILIVGGSVQVCDFGLARVLDSDVRKTSEAAGSYAYIAPELIEGKPSKTSDQYSLAISYVELRTGTWPFQVTSLYEVMLAHMQGRLDLSRLTEAERPIIKRATAVSPNDRYPTTSEMAKMLRRAVEGRQTSGRVSGFGGPVKTHDVLQPNVEIVPGYKLIRPLGRGGYGEVWEATAPGGKKHVALKVIGNLEGLGKQEFKALELITSVEHNHLLGVHAYFLLDGTGAVIPDDVRNTPDAPPAAMLVIATTLASKNLLERLNECRQAHGYQSGIPLPELLGYMRQAAQAIDYLNAPQHQLGDRMVSIQHRDIKPENILITPGAIKVGDFGLAKVLEGGSGVINSHSAGLTLAYAAPEVFSHEVKSTSDQYSLGITYFYLRVGKWPFEASAPYDIMMAHTQGKLDLSALPDAEREVVAKGTALVPEERFTTCLDMVEALEKLQGSGVLALQTHTPLETRALPSFAPRDEPTRLSGERIRPTVLPAGKSAHNLPPSDSGSWSDILPDLTPAAEGQPGPVSKTANDLVLRDQATSRPGAEDQTALDNPPLGTRTVPGDVGFKTVGGKALKAHAAVTQVAGDDGRSRLIEEGLTEVKLPHIPPEMTEVPPSRRRLPVRMLVVAAACILIGLVSAFSANSILYKRPAGLDDAVQAKVDEGKYDEAENLIEISAAGVFVKRDMKSANNAAREAEKQIDVANLETVFEKIEGAELGKNVKDRIRTQALKGGLEKALLALNASRYRDALTATDRILKAYPDNAEAKGYQRSAAEKLERSLLSQIDVQIREGKYGAAHDSLRDLDFAPDTKKRQRDRIQTSWLAQAEEYLRGHDYENAQKTVHDFLTRFSDDKRGQEILQTARRQVVMTSVKKLITENKFNEAGTELNKGRDTLAPDENGALLKQIEEGQKLLVKRVSEEAESHLLRNEFEQAEGLLKMHGTEFPDGGAVLRTRIQGAFARRVAALVDQQLKKEDYSQAISIIKASEAKLPDRGDSLRNLVRITGLNKADEAYVAKNNTRYDYIIKTLQSLLPSDPLIPGHKPPELGSDLLAKALNQARSILEKRPKEAIAILLPVQKQAEEDANSDQAQDVKLALAQAYARDGQWDDAMKRLASIKPERSEAAALKQALELLAEAQGELKPETAIEKLILFKPATASLPEGSWESKQITALSTRVTTALTAALKEADLDRAFALANKLQQYEPNQAEAQRQLASIAPLQDLSGKGARPAEITRAANKIVQLLKAGDPARPVQLCQALADAVEKNPRDLRAQFERLDDKAVDKLPAEARSHLSYAQAVVDQSSDKLDRAAAKIEQVVSADVSAPALATPERRKNALEILQEAATQLRDKNDFGNPYKTSERATQASRWLEAAAKLTSQPDAMPLASRLNRALAAGFKEKPAIDTALKIADEVLASPDRKTLSFGDQYVLLTLKAKSQDASAQGLNQAVGSYAEIVELVKANPEVEIPGKNYRESVLQPALEKGEKLIATGTQDAKQMEVLARLFVAKCQFIRMHPEEKWESDKNVEVFRCYDRAVKLAPSAEYLVARGNARRDLPERTNLKDLKADAEQAIALDKDYPDAYSLLGYVDVMQSREAGDDMETRIKSLNDAVSQCRRAIKMFEEKNKLDRREDLATAQTNLSIACTELANYDFTAQRKMLYEARDSADAASKLNKFSHWAWAALGNALEDMEWLLDEKKGNYRAAVEAFDEAGRASNDLPRYRRDRGRCQFKRVKYGKEAAKFLEEAVKDLETVRKRDSAEKADADYWLGRVYGLQGKIAEADARFAEAIDLAKKQQVRDWETYAIEWAQLALDLAREAAKAAPQDLQVLGSLCNQARVRAKLVLEAGKNAEAARITGQSFELEGKPKKALEEYNYGLPADLSKTRISQLTLLNTRISCWIARQWQKELNPDYRLLIKDADLASDLSRDPSVAPIIRAEALANAGLTRYTASLTADPTDQLEYRKDSVQKLRLAWTAKPDHPDNWIWRMYFGGQVDALLETKCWEEEEWKKTKDEAIEQLKKARGAAPSEVRARIASLIESVNQRSFADRR